MKRSTFALSLLLAVSVLLLPVASKAARIRSFEAAATRCHTPDLDVSLGPIRAGLGNVGIDVFLHNTSKRTCSLFGYVSLGLQDGRHRRQPSHVIRGSTYFRLDPGPHTIVLTAGARAVTNLAWADNPSPGEPQRGACEPISAWLEVTPPGERSHLLAHLGTSVCGRGRLTTTALRAARR